MTTCANSRLLAFETLAFHLGLACLGSALVLCGPARANANQAASIAAVETSKVPATDAFELGYDLGVGSVQASLAKPAPIDFKVLSAQQYAAVALGQAGEIARRVNEVSTQNGGPSFSQDSDRISSALYNPLTAAQLDHLYNSIVALREAHTAVFAKTSPRLANLYVLGVNIGIAEAQATQGEDARPLIEQALVAASEKTASAGLPPDPVENVLAALRRGTALGEVRTMIISARSTYSHSL